MLLIRKHGAVLQAWACLDLVMAYSRPTALNMKSPQKSQIVTSDNYELTFIL